MKRLEFPLVADENVHSDVIALLRSMGRDVRSVHDLGLASSDDATILERAHGEGRVVLTRDGDVGRLAIASGHPYVGIVFLRPGHIRVEFTMESLRAIASEARDVTPPFIVVAEHRGNTVRIRVRGSPDGGEREAD